MRLAVGAAQCYILGVNKLPLTLRQIAFSIIISVVWGLAWYLVMESVRDFNILTAILIVALFGVGSVRYLPPVVRWIMYDDQAHPPAA
jgi:hypothetical protein